MKAKGGPSGCVIARLSIDNAINSTASRGTQQRTDCVPFCISFDCTNTHIRDSSEKHKTLTHRDILIQLMLSGPTEYRKASHQPLLGLGQTDSRVADVVNRVPLPQESVTKNGKGSYGLGEIHAEEGRDARTLDFEDVVERANGEVVAGEREGKVGQTVALVALNRVLAVEALLGADLLVPAYS
jgi:hypothetical protein